MLGVPIRRVSWRQTLRIAVRSRWVSGRIDQLRSQSCVTATVTWLPARVFMGSPMTRPAWNWACAEAHSSGSGTRVNGRAVNGFAPRCCCFVRPLS